METSNTYNMCRLCLFRNNSLIDIFEVNPLHGYVVAEVISDLLSLKVYKDDGYPRVVCERCLEKLNEFKLFKEVCYTLKATYDNLFFNRRTSSQGQVEMIEVPVKLEPAEEEDNEPANFPSDAYHNAEFITSDTASEAISNSEIRPNQEIPNSEIISEVPGGMVKLEPREDIDIEESKPEELFHSSRDETTIPSRDNVIFHSQMSGASTQLDHSREYGFERQEESGTGSQYMDDSQKSSTPKKYRKLSLLEKKELIEFLEGHSERQTAAKYGISKTAVNSIRKRKERYLSLDSFPKRTSEFEQVNRLTQEWYFANVDKSTVTGRKLQEVALSYSRSLNLNNFKASSGWLESFKKRNHISLKMMAAVENVVEVDPSIVLDIQRQT